MKTKPHIKHITDVFEAFETNVALAGVLGVGPSTVSEMKRRKSIPVEYWPRIVGEAKKNGWEHLTFEKLAIMSAASAKRRSKAEAAQ